MVQRFAETDLSPKQVTNHDMGQAFEELLRKFNDVSPAGEQYTPRDVIELMVTLLFSGDDDVLSVPGVVRTMYDPTAGTGGILSAAEEPVGLGASMRVAARSRPGELDEHAPSAAKKPH